MIFHEVLGQLTAAAAAATLSNAAALAASAAVLAVAANLSVVGAPWSWRRMKLSFSSLWHKWVREMVRKKWTNHCDRAAERGVGRMSEEKLEKVIELFLIKRWYLNMCLKFDVIALLPIVFYIWVFELEFEKKQRRGGVVFGNIAHFDRDCCSHRATRPRMLCLRTSFRSCAYTLLKPPSSCQISHRDALLYAHHTRIAGCRFGARLLRNALCEITRHLAHNFINN